MKNKSEKPRLVCWYSHGAASLMAAKKAIEMQPDLYPDHEIVVACIYIKNEYQEPERIPMIESFLGHKVLLLRDKKYDADVDTVIQKTRYMSGVNGARCTAELKKAVRKNWQRFDDVHVFGFDCNEEDRVDRVLGAEPELEIFTPLIDLGISKEDCFPVIAEAGIPIPKMYQLGYHNNNCIGCVKAGGAGYWNKIRIDFPDVFARREYQEKMLNVSLCKMSANKIRKHHPEVIDKMSADGFEPKIDSRGTMRIPLRYLPESAGSHKDLDIGDCGFLCEIKE